MKRRRGTGAGRTAALALCAAALVFAGAEPSSEGDPAVPGAHPGRKKPDPPKPLDGTTFDYAYDGRDDGHPERSWLGRAFVHARAAAPPSSALPILVFIHGMNTEKIKNRWMGGGQEGDVRRIVADLIEAGQVPPMLVAAPSTLNADDAMTSWPAFDLDAFLALTSAKLAGAATIDLDRVIVATHSGGGCNPYGGISTAIRSKHVHTALVIDTCMFADLAATLGHARPTMNVVVSYTDLAWSTRPFADFRRIFEREVKKSPPAPGILREIEQDQPTEPGPHNAMVALTLRKWLPRLLPPPPPPPPIPQIQAATQPDPGGE
jgi:hypothetical protein